MSKKKQYIYGQYIYGLNCIVPVLTPHMDYYGPNLVTLGHLMTFLGAKKPDSGLIGASKGHYLRIYWPFFDPLVELQRSEMGH